MNEFITARLPTIDGILSSYVRTTEGIAFIGRRDRLVPTIAPERFEVLDFFVGRDAEHLYFRDAIVAGADAGTFAWLGYSGPASLKPARYARDRQAVWALREHARTRRFELVRVARLLPERTRVLSGGYAADDRCVAFNGTLVKGARSAHFVVLDAGAGVGTDQRNTFAMGKVVRSI